MKNGISVSALSEFVHEVNDAPEESHVAYGVHLDWETGTRSSVTTLPMEIGPHRVQRNFQWTIDEPRQLLGHNRGPNPQEILLSGLGGCILVGFVVGASVMGIQLERLSVEITGSLDLRGFFGLSGSEAVGFPRLRYRIRVRGDGTPEQFAELCDKALRHSPNAMTIVEPTKLDGELIVDDPSLSSIVADQRRPRNTL